jgi:uncharacterized membrane protein YecN with MAPEG domain
MSMNSIALVCAALMGLLLFGLGLAVSALRMRSGSFNAGSVETDSVLHRVARAHGNTAEFAPLLVALTLFLGARNPPGWAIGCIVGATASRFALVIGLVFASSMTRPNPMRFAGALGTYFFGAALCFALVR